MPTTADYLNDLVAQKESLIEALTDAGIEASSKETFSTLVPKANEKIASDKEDVLLLSTLFNDEPLNFNDDTIVAFQSPIFALSNIRSLSLPECRTLRSEGRALKGLFFGAANLSSIELPKCEEIYGETYTKVNANGVFANCSSLTEVYLPECTLIRNSYAFANCTKLRKIDMPKLRSITSEDNRFGSFIFSGNTALVEVNLPELMVEVGWVNHQAHFMGCTALEEISLPKTKAISYLMFQGCTKLKSVYAPLVEVIGYNAFNNCTSLIELELPACTNIGDLGVTAKNLTKLTLSSSGESISFSTSAFTKATSLTTIIFDGVLVFNLNFSKNSLDLDTAKRIIHCLENYAGTEKEYVYSLTLSANTRNLLIEEGATAPNGVTWLDYAYNKGWNI